MGRDRDRPGNTGASSGGAGSNADKDRRAASGMSRGTTDLAGERQRMRAMGADTITPKYGWDQARMSDFGITGGVMNALKGIYDGNTYSGRMPQGLRAGFSGDPTNRAAQMMPDLSDAELARYFPHNYPFDRLKQNLGLLVAAPSAAAPEPQGLRWNPRSYQPTAISVPGGMNYSTQFDPWKYFA